MFNLLPEREARSIEKLSAALGKAFLRLIMGVKRQFSFEVGSSCRRSNVQ